jgi:hypothetical protein
VTGAVAPDGGSLRWLEIQETFTQPNVPNRGDTSERRTLLRLVNVPLAKQNTSTTVSLYTQLAGQNAVAVVERLDYLVQYSTAGDNFTHQALGLARDLPGAWAVRVSLQK